MQGLCFQIYSFRMCFDNENLQLNTEERYCHQLQQADIPYYIVYGEKTSKLYNYPFQKSDHKITLSSTFIEMLKINFLVTILFCEY